MLSRGLLLAAIVAAVAIPYAVVHEPGGTSVSKLLEKWRGQPTATSTPVPSLGSGTTPHFQLPQAPWNFTPNARSGNGLPPGATATPWMPIDGSAPGLVGNGIGSATVQAAVGQFQGARHQQQGPAIQELGDLFRFDLTPTWVVQSWPRVSSQLGEFGFTGLRVPVVTGTELHDMAGSLTYYFDSQQLLQRIAFQGTTGDPSQLIQLATSQYGMQPYLALGGSCYARRTKEKTMSMLRVKHATVSHDARPQQRYRVELELNRPGSPHGLSYQRARTMEQESRILQAAQKAAAGEPESKKATPKTAPNSTVDQSERGPR